MSHFGLIKAIHMYNTALGMFIFRMYELLARLIYE
jgi:hypothetical protein